MDKLEAMATFVAVVEAGSFVHAMDARELSRAAISRHIAELERLLGTRLLQRTTRRVSITEEGRLYYNRCKELLGAVQDAESEVSQKSGQARGRLRVGAPQDFGVEQLAPLWGEFRSRYPNVELDITLSDRKFDLIEEGYDLTIRIGHLVDSDLVARPLAPVRLVACAAPTLFGTRGTPVHPSELSDYPFIAYSYHTNGDHWVFRNSLGEQTGVQVRPGVHVNNGATCRAMAVAGLGVTVQPDFLVQDAIRKGQLVELMPTWKTGPEALMVYALYPTRRMLPLKVQHLRDFLVDAFKKPAWSR